VETDLNERVRSIIEIFRREKGGAYQQVKIITDSKPEIKEIMLEILTEDRRNPKKDYSYLEFLTDLNKLVISKS